MVRWTPMRASALAILSCLPSSLAQNATATTSPVATIAGQVVTYSPAFTVPASADEGANLIPNIRDPQAVDAQSVCPGYKASNVGQNTLGFTAQLSLAGPACNVYGTDIDRLNLTVQYQSADRLSVYIVPSNLSPANVSHHILDPNVVRRPVPDSDAASYAQDNDLQFTWTNSPTFQFSVIRRTTGDVVFTTMGSKLVYENQFIEFVTQMPDNYNIYGIGEHIHALRLGNNYTATLFAADAGDVIDQNIYGSHPVYADTRYYEVDEATGNMTLHTSNTTDANATYTSFVHGMYNRNAHIQEVLMRANNVTWRALGGAIDLYFFDGPSFEDVAKQYQVGAIGLPAMQKFHTLGFHQCRWGYQNFTVLQDVVDNFRNYGIPLEHIWSDIDYMKQYRDFTLDPNAFPVSAAATFFKTLAANNQHYIPIVDSAIYSPNPANATDAYVTYDRGHAADVFMKNPDGTEYIGSVWPGYTVFPDWHAMNSTGWWTDEMVRFYNDVKFSGIWIDMSEASSFCIGSCGTGNLSLNPVHPPFLLPGEAGNLVLDYPEGFNLTNATEASSAAAASSSQSAMLAMSASSVGTTSAGTTTQTGVSVTTGNGQGLSTSATSTVSYLRTTPTPGVRNVEHPPYVIDNVLGDLSVHAISPNATHADGVQDYDVHNLWGHQILNATYRALEAVFPGKRPFIIGRSNFAGSGQFAGHWGGDNFSKWYIMYFSIPQALQFQLFGMPFFGVDTCGFAGNSDEELCNRWMQLSAFFPFYRNHNTIGAISQEPYIWASVADATKKAINIRYQLLPYMYTLLQQSSTTGSTWMRAMSWEFPNDPSLADADRQFLVGPSLLVTPVLVQGATSVNGVFPGVKQGTVWYDWYTQSRVNAQAGVNTTISAPLGHIPLYIRGGSILPTQQPGYTTYESRRNPYGLLVALSETGAAKGNLYIDDGESITPNATKNIDFVVSRNTLYASVRGAFVDTNPLANVTILGLSSQPSSVRFNNASLSTGWTYNSTSKVLFVGSLNNVTASGAYMNDWRLSWS